MAFTHLLAAFTTALGGLLALPSPPDAPASEPGPLTAATYYVDCAGSDGASGTSPTSAWRTLGRASAAALGAGGRLLLKRDCTWWGQRLDADWHGTEAAPVVVGAYGSGDDPRIWNGPYQGVKVSGSHVVLEQLVVGHSPSRFTSCGQPLGVYYGVNFTEGAHDSVLQDSLVTGSMAGVHLARDSWANTVRRNVIAGNDVVDAFHADPAQDLGAWGVLVVSDDNDISWNQFVDNRAVCSNQGYRLMSNSVEIFEGKRNRIHHNRSVGDRVFSELGGSWEEKAADNVFAYNRFANDLADSRFVVTRGSDESWGPVYRTTVVHNTTYLTGPRSQGVVCMSGCTPNILTMRWNLIWAEEKVLYADGTFEASRNLFWSSDGDPFVQAPFAVPAIVANPQFVDRWSATLTLSAGSPAIDAGDVSTAWGVALNGVPLYQGWATELGAYERAD
ncbi:MAG TPA: choice-of-anchor Q domain-containing protein [Acidimicrobiales bacterium]|jgi:hypothetical protein